VQADAASAGVSGLATTRPASAGTAESKPMGSSATPYVFVAAGLVLALILVAASVDTSDYDCNPGDFC
jgi:hypothetical protein